MSNPLIRYWLTLLLCILPVSASHGLPVMKDVSFDVLRNGKTVGVHETRFENSGRDIHVISRMEMEVSFLTLTLYAFSFHAIEVWQNGHLKDMSVTVIDDGQQSNIAVTSTATGLSILSDTELFQADRGLMTTNHWNPDVLDQKRILNTLTGRINDVVISSNGIEEVAVVGGQIKANRYDYSGDLSDVSVWYDVAGNWVKLTFLASDGSAIEYRCRNCLSGRKKS